MFKKFGSIFKTSQQKLCLICKLISMKKIFIVFLFFIFESFTILSQVVYFPDVDWQTKKPSEVKMNAALLDSAVNFAINHDNNVDYDLRIANIKAYANEPGYKLLGPTKQRGKPAGIILRHGYIVAQWGDVNRVDMTFSVTKSYLSTIFGLAQDAKLIRNMDEKVNNYVLDDKFEGEHNAKITWRHLLNQTSDWSGCLFDVCDWSDRPPKTGGIDDWKFRKLLEPGSTFEYNDARVNLLSYSLLQVWRKPLPIVLKEKIMDSIGASTTWRWYGYDNSFVNMDGLMVQSVSGGGHFGGGLFINTLDQARFGLLFARHGKWKNNQLVSENWVNSVSQPAQANNQYGLMWWTNRANTFPSMPSDMYYANGFGGNYIVIDNRDDLVIVTRWLDNNALVGFLKLVTNALEDIK